MTEDDTFRRLKRIPFVDMQKVHSEWLDTINFYHPTRLDYEKYGWTEGDFYKEYNNRYPLISGTNSREPG